MNSRSFVLVCLVLASCTDGPSPAKEGVSKALGATDGTGENGQQVGEERTSTPSPRLNSGEASLDELGRKIVAALCAGDKNALHQLSVSTIVEYQQILPAIANHPTAFKIPIDVLFASHNEDSLDAVVHATNRYGGQDMEFVGWEWEGEPIDKGTIIRHTKPVLVLKGSENRLMKLRLCGTILEDRSAQLYKVLGFR